MTIFHYAARALAALNDFIGADEASFEETRQELLRFAGDPDEADPDEPPNFINLLFAVTLPGAAWNLLRIARSFEGRKRRYTQIINGREYYRSAIETRDDTDPDWTQK